MSGKLPGLARRTMALAVMSVLLGGCSHFHHRGHRTARCADPDLPAAVPNLPALKVAPGMTAPDARNAVVIPPVDAPADKPEAAKPCLSTPPSYKG